MKLDEYKTDIQRLAELSLELYKGNLMDKRLSKRNYKKTWS